MRTKASNNNKFLRFITIPYRVLIKAKDYYVRSITECSQTVNYGNMAGGSAGLPKSFSVSSSRSRCSDDDDFGELIRAASSRSMGNGVDMDLLMQQLRQSTAAKGPKGVLRSCSVGMGKIDEEKPCCDFGEEEDHVHAHAHGRGRVRAELLYPRSKSYAVSST
ncbi:uncharacterized protein LOC132279246 [Cornus florida]|uniref:uncharacterized protein LOC132279246 n=1 Tax=Cornus florida TaxID=4283 RepID=UPI002896C809|nr:uncharacterized protein LOC132279246 [Cornus florida]